MSSPDRLGRDAGQLIGLVAAALLHLIVGVLHLSAGLVAPGWAVLLLLVEWIALATLVWRWRRRPFAALAVPFASAAILYFAVTLGDVFLGWTA